MRTALVFAGGDPPPADRLGDLDRSALVIAADSGLDHALALGFTADVVVGDLDSVTPDALARARDAGADVEPHPAEKDETDLELALRRRAGARRVARHGGRRGWRPPRPPPRQRAGARPRRLRGPRARRARRHGAAHDDPHPRRATRCTGIIPLAPPPRRSRAGIRTEGLRYSLRDEDLAPGTTRGVSNEFLAPIAVVSLVDGVLLAVQPDLLSPTLSATSEA